MSSESAAPLRVIHLASGREWRGGQRQVVLLARALAEQPGVEQLVITGADTPLAVALADSGIRVHEATWSMGLDPRVIAAALGEITPGSIVHAHDSHSHTLADAAIRFRPAALVCTRRVVFPIGNTSRWRRTTAAIALSEPVRTQLIAAGVPTDRIHLIPPAVDLEAATDGESWPAAFAPPGEGPLVVCIAALTSEKGIDVLIEAAARLKDELPELRWLVLGEGSQRSRLEGQLRKLGIEDRVTLAGFIDNPAAVFTHATLAVQPSRSEGFGSSVLDALAHGVPVIASSTGGLPESLAHGGGMLVPTGEAPALAGAVRDLLADPARRREMAIQARAAALQFGTDRLVSRTLDVYRSVQMTDRPT